MLLSSTFKFYDPETYKNRFQELDANRRFCHILMTQAINKVNRLCDSYGIDKIFDTGLNRELYSEENSNEKNSGNIAIQDRDLARKIALKYYNEVLSNGINHEKTFEESLVEEDVLNKK